MMDIVENIFKNGGEPRNVPPARIIFHHANQMDGAKNISIQEWKARLNVLNAQNMERAKQEILAMI
jgi:hypothetical protein